MDQQFKNLLIDAFIQGILWAIMFYFVRKGLNKRNFIENPEKKRVDFFWDAVYGGLAMSCLTIAKKYIVKQVNRFV